MLPYSPPPIPHRNPTTDLDLARELLASARAELDRAVAALPPTAGDEVMAPPQLFPLLVRAVKARQHLQTLEPLSEGNIQ